jgi:hypothetical protein
MKNSLYFFCTILSYCTIALHAATVLPKPPIVASQLPDVLEILSPADIRVEGWLGNRVTLNERNRLAQIDLEPLLAGFRKKPGTHPWIGEHIGKWMHASTLAWANTGDAALRKMLDYAATELIMAQEPDGYLGTYVPEKRFGLYRDADWDVWSHKYNLIGLLTYYEYTGNPSALAACRKIGDLLVTTFPAKKSIITAGTHVGMAATSVLEPMVLLYRHTGDERYLYFCRYLVKAWNEPNGPKIIASLLEHGQVNKTANAKAYEMLSNLVGLCELARATGDRELLRPVLDAWQDIVAKRLYITGTCSQAEHFHDDFHLPNGMSAHVGEQCVTTTWIQLNWQLLRLTGEPRFGEQLEKTFYNQLSAAQRPDGAQWCYFTSPEGTKPYGPGINCCVSSGPRGMALIPQSTVLRSRSTQNEPETLVFNLLGSSFVNTRIAGRPVEIEQRSQFPRKGDFTFIVRRTGSHRFGIRIRLPAWSGFPEFVGETSHDWRYKIEQGWLILPPQTWRKNTRFTLRFRLEPKAVAGEHGNTGLTSLQWGPFVLAYDQKHNPGLPLPALVSLAEFSDPKPFELNVASSEALLFTTRMLSSRKPGVHPATLVPFADAGADGGRYSIWLRSPGTPPPVNPSLFAFAEESRSEAGNVEGSISDGDIETFVVTFNSRPQTEAFFSVQREQPVEFRRVVFAHGETFHDGGWFDTSSGRARIEVKREAASAWEKIGELNDYPATTTSNAAGLKDGQSFSLKLAVPVKALAIRIVGKPASGDNPQQAFASCAEIQAYGD